MTEQQKRIAIIGGGAVVLFLLYRLYTGSSQNAASTAGQAAATGQADAASQYAALAGQEQSDVAGLQSQNQQLLAQEQSDVQTLTSAFTQYQADQAGQLQALQAAQAQSNSAFTGLIQGLQATLAGLTGTTHTNVPATASGAAPVNRASTPSRPSGAQEPFMANSALAQLNSLLAQGFHKVAGTTQQGGLAQTGTYVKGGTKYFVWGTKATGLNIRKAA